MATDYCIYCKTKHTAFAWKNLGEGWFCDEYFNPVNSEFIPQRMKDDRQKYQKSTLQPFRDGTLSSEFVQTYGTSSLNVTKEDVRKSKPVWKDTLKSGWEKSQ